MGHEKYWALAAWQCQYWSNPTAAVRMRNVAKLTKFFSDQLRDISPYFSNKNHYLLFNNSHCEFSCYLSFVMNDEHFLHKRRYWYLWKFCDISHLRGYSRLICGRWGHWSWGFVHFFFFFFFFLVSFSSFSLLLRGRQTHKNLLSIILVPNFAGS